MFQEGWPVTFENVNFLCFGKWALAYTKEKQYNKRKAVSRNENYSTFESGWPYENNYES